MCRTQTWVLRAGCAAFLVFGCSAAGSGGLFGDGPGSNPGAVEPASLGGAAPATSTPPSTTEAGTGAAGAMVPAGDASEAQTSPEMRAPEAAPGRDLPLKPDGFLGLAPPRGEPFDRAGGTALNPPPPPGWTWYSVPGTSCRDGSEAGLFIRFAESKRLLIYFEGGGACTTTGFCNFNPQSVNHVLSGTGETVLGSALGAVPG